MALNDAATLVINTGNFLTAAVGTALPTNLTAPGIDWTNVGHTSLEDIFGASSEGGEATTLGTLQAKTLRTTYSPRSESFTFTLQQFDTASLKLYYGSNATVNADGTVGIPSDPQVTTAAFLAVFVDGANEFAIYAPKAELFRGDDLEFADSESLAGMPISVKPVVYGTNGWAYAVTPLG